MFGRLRGTGPGAVLARGSLVSLSLRCSAAVLGLIVQLALARALGVTEYGVYVYVLSWLVVLGMLTRLGMDKGLTRLVAQYRAQSAWDLLRGVLAWAMRNVVAISLAAALVGAAVTWALRASLSPSLEAALLIGMLMLPVSALSLLRQGALRGLRMLAKADVPETVVRPLALLTLLGLAYALSGAVAAPAAMAVTLGADITAFALGSFWLARALPTEVRESAPRFENREWWHVSVPLLFLHGMQMILGRLDVLMLGTMLGPEPAGIYGAVTRVAELTVFGLMVVNPIVAPLISEYFHTSRRAELQRVVTLSARLVTAVTVAGAVFLVLFGKWVLALFGPAFVAGYATLMILLAGKIVSGFCGSVGYLMTMTGHQKMASGILAAAAAINVVGNVLLIPRYGIEGAAVAMAISVAFWNVAMLVYVRRKIGVRSTI